MSLPEYESGCRLSEAPKERSSNARDLDRRELQLGRNSGAGLVASALRLPRCALLADLGYKGPQSACVMPEERWSECAVYRYFRGKMDLQEANDQLSRLGVKLVLQPFEHYINNGLIK